MNVDFNDSLRGLLDRDTFLRIVSRLRGGIVEKCRHFATIVIDIDCVDRVSERIGADCSDFLTRLVTDRLRELLPSQAIAGRLRPEALAVMSLQDIDRAVAEALCARLHHALRGKIDLGGHEVFLSASIGVAFTGPRTEPLKALQHAERAVERVKANGGDATFFYRQHQPLIWRQSA